MDTTVVVPVSRVMKPRALPSSHTPFFARSHSVLVLVACLGKKQLQPADVSTQPMGSAQPKRELARKKGTRLATLVGGDR